jgi:hypothetical protein
MEYIRYVVAQLPYHSNTGKQWRIWDEERNRFISYHETQADAANICTALNHFHQWTIHKAHGNISSYTVG